MTFLHLPVWGHRPFWSKDLSQSLSVSGSTDATTCKHIQKNQCPLSYSHHLSNIWYFHQHRCQQHLKHIASQDTGYDPDLTPFMQSSDLEMSNSWFWLIGIFLKNDIDNTLKKKRQTKNLHKTSYLPQNLISSSFALDPPPHKIPSKWIDNLEIHNGKDNKQWA